MTVRGGPCGLFPLSILAIHLDKTDLGIAAGLQLQLECTDALASMNTLSAVSRVCATARAAGFDLMYHSTLLICLMTTAPSTLLTGMTLLAMIQAKGP
jgi:hypothetical protein